MNAFPIAISADCEGYEDGMTLRDYFAGQALIGILAGRSEKTEYPPRHIAERAYVWADAMLEARDA
jgi:hypothetical protein